MLTNKDKDTINWLSNNTLFIDRLWGKKPRIDLAKSKARLLEKIQQLPTPPPSDSQTKAHLKLQSSDSNSPVLSSFEVD